MPSHNITLDTADGPMPAYLSSPPGQSRGGIVVIQEAFGVTRHIEEVTERLAGEGWTALAPALFHRDGSPVIDYEDLASARPVMQNLRSDALATDLAAAFDHLAGLGFDAPRQGIVGFCMGGSVSFSAATERQVGAAVTFYGGGIAEGRFGYPPQIDAAAGLLTPWLGLYGDQDKGIPVDQVEQLRAACAAAPVETEIVRYPDAQHGFNCDDRPAVYDPGSAADAWARTLDWFARHLEVG